MKLGILFSGGKDSMYATYLAKKASEEVVCLISVLSENKDSYMFHTPSIEKVKKQAEVMHIPLILGKTKGEKEKELKDLKEIIKKAILEYQIEGIVTGAVESVYQSSRIQKICNELNIEVFNPLWQKNPEEYWDELLKNNFDVVITGVSADGLGEEWLGQRINRKKLRKLKEISEKYGIHLSFEGGEAETFIIDCPLFRKKLNILKSEKKFFANSGTYDIIKID